MRDLRAQDRRGSSRATLDSLRFASVTEHPAVARSIGGARDASRLPRKGASTIEPARRRRPTASSIAARSVGDEVLSASSPARRASSSTQVGATDVARMLDVDPLSVAPPSPIGRVSGPHVAKAPPIPRAGWGVRALMTTTCAFRSARPRPCITHAIDNGWAHSAELMGRSRPVGKRERQR
jgi:hypothetical protein